MVLDVAFSIEWKWSVVMVPFILLTLAPSTEAKYDFPVYRMNQYDLAKEPFGSRTSLVSFEGRTADAAQLTRKTVLVRIEDLTAALFNSILEKGPGAILVLLPDEINAPSFPANVSQARIDKINEAEKVLLSTGSTNVPIYFSYENAELGQIYSNLAEAAEFTGAKAILNAGNQVVHQFSVTGAQPSPQTKKKLFVAESRLGGAGETPRVILITARLDAMAASFGLAKGANQGTGAALTLELARLLSIVYEDDSTRPKVTAMFALMPGDTFNYLATKDWLQQVNHEDNVELNLKNIDLAICLDGIGLSGPLYVHYSKPPKEGTIARFFFDALSGNNHKVDVKGVHRKINIADDKVYWQHEQFSRNKVPALTVSSSSESSDIARQSILDTVGLVDISALTRNAAAISDALVSTVYRSTIEDEKLAISPEAIAAWTHQLATEPRPAGNMTARLANDINKHMERFSSDGKVNQRQVCGEVTLYDQNVAVMSQFLVRPALFDLYLGAIIFSYLGLIYASIEHFGMFLSFAQPLLSKPELFKKQKSF